MRHYLQTIHTRSDSHKKRFALLASAGITLSIFAIWSLVRFSPLSSSEVMATNEVNVPENMNTAKAIAPLDNLTSGIRETFTALKDQFNSVKGTVKSVDLQGEYNQMRNDALNTSSTNAQ